MKLIIADQTVRKITAAMYYIIILLFLAAVVISIVYQASYIFKTNPNMPFLEPDNYEYYLFANLAIAHPGLTPSNITNPYLIGGTVGFFEHPGLYLMPVYLYDILHLPLVWEFRILQAIAIFIIYLFSLLIVRKVIRALPVSKIYHWLAYTIVLTSFLLMQYNEVIEWRGNEFIVAISIVILYLIAWIYTKRDDARMVLAWLPITALAILAIWIWSAGGIIVVPLVTILFAGLSFYKLLLSKHSRVWRYVALAGAVGAVIIFFFAGHIEYALSIFTSHYGFSGCLSNPLHIGELSCLNVSNGLIAILMMLVFSSFALAAFLGNTIMSNKKKDYEYYLVGTFIAAILFLPLAMIYIRLLDLIAPYFTILYALGIVAMLSYFSKSGSNRIVLSLTIILILISAFVGQYLFYLSSSTLYSLANPAGLVNATEYISSTQPNATVLTYFGYGGYMEAYGHLRVYADTIQGLNYTKIGQIDRVFGQNISKSCQVLKTIQPQPDFIMISNNMLNSSLFVNASNNSVLKNPQFFNNACGYTLQYDKKGFVVFLSNSNKREGER